MAYFPGIAYHGDQYIAGGNQLWASIASSLIGDMINRGRQKDELLETFKTLQGYGQQPPAAAGPGVTPAPYGQGPPSMEQSLRYGIGASAGIPGQVLGLGQPQTQPQAPQTMPEGAAGAAEPGVDPDEVASKQAKALRNVMAIYGGKNLEHKSKDELEGMMKAIAVRSHAEDQLMKQQEMQNRGIELAMRAKEYAAEVDLRKQQAAEEAAAGEFVHNYFNTPRENVLSPEVTPDQQMAYASAMNPGIGGRALTRAYDVTSAMEDAAARRQEMAQRGQDYAAQTALRKQQALDDVTTGQFVRNYFQTPGDPQTLSPPTPSDQWAFATANTPNLSGRHLNQIIDSLTKYQTAAAAVQEGGASATAFAEDPVSHSRFVTKGKSILPSGVNPEFAQPQIIEQHDKEGSLIGFSHVDAKGRGTFYPFKGGAVVQNLVDDQGNPIPGRYVTSQGKEISTQTALEKAGFGVSKAPDQAPAPAAPSLRDRVKNVFGPSAAAAPAGAPAGVVASFDPKTKKFIPASAPEQSSTTTPNQDVTADSAPNISPQEFLGALKHKRAGTWAIEYLGKQLARMIGPSPDTQALQIGSSVLQHDPGEIYSSALLKGKSDYFPELTGDQVWDYVTKLPERQRNQLFADTLANVGVKLPVKSTPKPKAAKVSKGFE